MNPDLKRIKKLYGENMMHLCRTLFPTILETPGKLVELLTENFEPNRMLYNDIIGNEKETEFQEYILDLTNDEKEIQIEGNKTVRELLSEAGYDFFECNSEEDIQSFRHYYQKMRNFVLFGQID